MAGYFSEAEVELGKVPDKKLVLIIARTDRPRVEMTSNNWGGATPIGKPEGFRWQTERKLQAQTGRKQQSKEQGLNGKE